MDLDQLNELTVDFLILADRVEALQGKLYMMGGAWDRQMVRDFTRPVPISFALSILVPWTRTNEEHQIVIELVDANSTPTGLTVEGAFTAGRPPTAIKGEAQRVTLAFPGIPHVFPGPGRYVLRVAINGELRKQVGFSVVEAGPGALA